MLLPIEFARKIKQEAVNLNFDICKIIPYTNPRYQKEYLSWVNAKQNAQMKYLENSIPVRLNPQKLVNDYKINSIIVLAKKYQTHSIPSSLLKHRDLKKYGLIANYALAYANARDYHRVIKKQMLELDKYICTNTNRNISAKCLVDSAPVLERDFGEIAGIGFIGKNTCLINPDIGSWFFISTIWLPERFTSDAYDQFTTKTYKKKYSIINFPLVKDLLSFPIFGSCGDCDRCLRLCPTNALTVDRPFILDANKCISYWTIEAKNDPPKDIAKKFGNWIFGCDICQTVCPWNMRIAGKEREVIIKRNESFDKYIFPKGPLLILKEGLNPQNPYLLDSDAFIEKFKATPIMRTGREGMLRNIKIAIYNANCNI